MKIFYLREFCFLILFFLFGIYSNAATKKAHIIIEGNIAGLPAKYMYLRSAFSKQIIDSSICDDGRFRFELKTPDFEPILVSLFFKSDNQRQILLTFRNDFLTNTENEYKTTGFYLDTGITFIHGNFVAISKTAPTMNPVSLTGSRLQNEPLFLTQLLDLALIDPRQDTTLRNKEIITLKGWIKRYPLSFWFMNRVYANKRFYSSYELVKLYDLFDPAVQNSTQGRALLSFANPTGLVNVNLNELKGKDTLNKSHPLTYEHKPTLIIFWASWCVPCRKEIPYLKTLAEQYGGKSGNTLQFLSISIDKDENAWKNTVRVEKMRWQQLLISENQSTELMKQYRFDAIPFILLVDSNGKEYARFNDGYSESPNKELEAKISTLLKLK